MTQPSALRPRNWWPGGRRRGQRKLAEAQTVVAEQALAKAETTLYFNTIEAIDRETLAGNVSQADRCSASPPSLRNWEWHYLKRVSHMEELVIPAHRDAIRRFVRCLRRSYLECRHGLGGQDLGRQDVATI